MIKRQPVECWSRVVGFFRPVSQYNNGKKAEFDDRITFKVNKNGEKD
jgi:ribonucleoside-triphosphate reductase